MGLDAEDLEKFMPESPQEKGEHTPSEDEIEEFMDKNQNLLEDEETQKMLVVGLYIGSKMYHETDPELERQYEELMEDEGLNPDSVEDALEYLNGVTSNVSEEYEI